MSGHTPWGLIERKGDGFLARNKKRYLRWRRARLLTKLTRMSQKLPGGYR